jgi:hypothetical protein
MRGRSCAAQYSQNRVDTRTGMPAQMHCCCQQYFAHPGLVSHNCKRLMTMLWWGKACCRRAFSCS